MEARRLDRHWPVPSQRLGRSFPRSTLAPEPGSRRLCAGCHQGSKQVFPQARPEYKSILGFDIINRALDAFVNGLPHSPSRFSPDALSRTPFSQRSPPRPLCRRSSRWFGASSCEAAPGDLPHRQRNITSGCPIYIGSTLHVRGATFAALLGLAANFPGNYREAGVDKLEERVNPDEWVKPDPSG